MKVLLMTLAWAALAGHAAAVSNTCPANVAGCRPDMNHCRMCHHTCEFCQSLAGVADNGMCGPDDCMTCIEGYRLVEEYEDGTGYCTDEDEIFLDTCPKSQAGCSSRNKCKTCHETCEYCQGDEDHCGIKDCMTCKSGLKHWAIFTDETGECLPPGVSLEKHQLTCPNSVPGCHEDNRCLECHPTCDTCQSSTTKNGMCTSTDCWTCHDDYKLIVVNPSGTGKCVPRSSGKVAVDSAAVGADFGQLANTGVMASFLSDPIVIIVLVAVSIALISIFRRGRRSRLC